MSSDFWIIYLEVKNINVLDMKDDIIYLVTEDFQNSKSLIEILIDLINEFDKDRFTKVNCNDD